MARKFLSSLDMASQKVVNLLAGTSGTDAVNKTQLDTKLTTTGATSITVSTTAPSSPATGDLWVDTN